MTPTERSAGLDIVRTFAIFSVLSVHFFLNTHFYETPLTGKNMFIQTIFRTWFMSCVPLFLMLTGYLQTKKEPKKSYYKNIIPISVIYIIYSILSLVYSRLYLNDHKSILNYVASIFNFTADAYSWYINMYIGLFLLSPFLNILYNNISNKKQKIILIGSLLCVTSLPNLLNGYIGGKVLFFADYWIQMYPISYYFLGSYIKEYQVKINKFNAAGCILALSLFASCIEMLTAKGGDFAHYIVAFDIGAFGSIIIVFQTILFFLIFYDIDIKKGMFSRPFSLISVLSLDIYLASYITDRIVYKYFLYEFSELPQQKLFLFFPIVVLSTFSFAFILALARQYLIKIR
jgi:surface polysaccharide O-acyltransferase-like enzyme